MQNDFNTCRPYNLKIKKRKRSHKRSREETIFQNDFVIWTRLKPIIQLCGWKSLITLIFTRQEEEEFNGTFGGKWLVLLKILDSNVDEEIMWRSKTSSGLNIDLVMILCNGWSLSQIIGLIQNWGYPQRFNVRTGRRQGAINSLWVWKLEVWKRKHGRREETRNITGG